MPENERSHLVARIAKREHALEQIIKDMDALMNKDFPFFWKNDRRAIVIRERIRELGIVERKQVG